MNSSVMMTTAVVLSVLGSAFAGIAAPVAFSAPLVAAPAAIGYAKAVPYNIPPYASRVDISTRNLAAPYVAAPYIAAPAAAAPIVAAAPALPYAALPAAPLVAAPGVIPSAYAGSLSAPLAYAYARQAAGIIG